MNKNAKSSLIFAILPIAAILLGFLALIVLGKLFTYPTSEIDPEAPGAGLGMLFVALGNAIIMIFISIVDLVLTSIAVYGLAYYSHKYAKNAIAELTESGESIKLPKALSIISKIEMIIAAIAAIITLLFLTGILTMSAV